MTVAYATEDDLADWLPEGTDVPTDASRQLQRASSLLDRHVRTPFHVDTDTNLPTDADVAAALRDAACAQVEFWCETGEEHDIDGLAGQQYSVAGYSGKRPPRLAPRAVDALDNQGLMTFRPGLPEEWP